MDLELIAELRCPYCGAAFRIAQTCHRAEGRLKYGLLECRCFRFPVVDGILLLSLSKGFGASQEVFQPYVPLLVAAVQYLERDDVAGLEGWIRKHMPLAAELMEGSSSPYLSVFSRLNAAVDREVRRYLDEYGQYEVVGVSGRRAQLRRAIGRRPSSDIPKAATSEQVARSLSSYYVSRFYSPRVNTLAVQLQTLPIAERVLSLCCGHGVFENLLSADGRAGAIVCVDAMFLNLLITRRYACPNGVFICHDIEYPLPFADGAFNSVFSSTCLPEIPGQRTVVSEAVRVTASSGWTVFDSIWNEESGVKRIDRFRYYGFCQNFFSKLTDYVSFFEECSGPGREVGVAVLEVPENHLGAGGWKFGEERIQALTKRRETHISVIVRGHERPFDFVEPNRRWLTANKLSVSPVYDVTKDQSRVALCRLPEFGSLAPGFAPASFGGYPQSATVTLDAFDKADWLTRQFYNSLLVILPNEFDESSRTLEAIAAS